MGKIEDERRRARAGWLPGKRIEAAAGNFDDQYAARLLRMGWKRVARGQRSGRRVGVFKLRRAAKGGVPFILTGCLPVKTMSACVGVTVRAIQCREKIRKDAQSSGRGRSGAEVGRKHMVDGLDETISRGRANE